MNRLVLALLSSAAALVAVAPVGALPNATPKPPAVKITNAKFGNILQSTNRLPLYYWSVEKRAGGKIRCTGQCARVWPPLIVKSRAAVRPTVRGVKGRFAVVRRPDGRLQATFRGLPLYAYHDDPPNTVLCDNVDGWFVVRV